MSSLDDRIALLVSDSANTSKNLQRFDVPRKLKSQNELKGNSRAGNGPYVTERSWWHKQFATAVMAGLVTIAKGPKYVRITRYSDARGKVLDVGNMVGGCKALVDAMVNVGILVDDSPEFCSIYYRQMRGTINEVRFEVWE